MEELIFIVIVIAVVVINIFRKMAEYKSQRPGAEADEWEEWQGEGVDRPPSGPGGAQRSSGRQAPPGAEGRRGPSPSDRVRTILQQLEQMESGRRPLSQRAEPPPTPAPVAQTPPRPKPVADTPRPKPVADTPAPMTPRAVRPPQSTGEARPYARPPHRRYLGEDALPTVETASRQLEADVSQTSDEAAARVARESLAKAFPSAMRMVRATRVGARRPIVVKATGRRSLRRAVVLSEVLGQPRAFDV